MSKFKSHIFAFEGVDGSGKSIIAKMVYRILKEEGEDVVLFSAYDEDDKDSKRLRMLWKNGNISKSLRASLILEARTILVKNKILPALEDGKIVLVDRFHTSSIVYQQYVDGIAPDWFQEMGREMTEYHMTELPDVAYDILVTDIFLNARLDTAMSRIGNRGTTDSLEARGEHFLVSVIDGYRSYYEELREQMSPEALKMAVREIDANNTLPSVLLETHREVKDVLKKIRS